MVLLDKLECTINTADGVLEEFPVPPEDDKDSDAPYPLKTVYIKAGEGKEFYIEFKAHYYAPKNEPEYDKLGLLVVLDGRGDHYNKLHLTERLWWSKNTRSTFPNSSVNRTIKGRTNGNMLRKFRFSKINLTEELGGNYHIPDERLDLLGDIKVIVIRYKLGITRGNSGITCNNSISSSSLEPIVAPEDTVHEKKIKIILEKNLTVSYSQPETYNRKCTAPGIKIDSDTKPYAMFRFLYRSESALKDLGVIPRTPSASPVPDELMSRGALLKELKKLREDNENMRTSVKRERKDDSDEELYSQPNHRPKHRMISKSQSGSTASEAIVLD